MPIATDIVTGSLGTIVNICETVPTLTKLPIHNGRNDTEVATAEAARIQEWQTFDDDNTNEFVEVLYAITAGEIGATFTMNEVTTLADGLTMPYKGSVSAGGGTFDVAYNANDPGQKILRKFGMSRRACSFRYDMPDGEKRYFIALVGGDAVTVGGADDFKQQSAELRLVDFQTIVPPGA